MVERLRAWSSLGGLAFVVLAVIGAAFLFDGPQASSPAKMTAWYSSSSNRTHINIGWVLTGLALLRLIWFVAAVRERVAFAERADAANGSFLSTLVTMGGTVFVAAGVCQIGIASGIKTMSDDTYHHQVYSGLIHAAGDASYVILAGSGIAMASRSRSASCRAGLGGSGSSRVWQRSSRSSSSRCSYGCSGSP